jgi:homogentisate phytyltransferase/homogentisate geranylgeranyltransferase
MLRPQVLWRFARPHTVYGTSASVVGLYLLAGFVAAGSLQPVLSALPPVGLGLGGLSGGPMSTSSA